MESETHHRVAIGQHGDVGQNGQQTAEHEDCLKKRTIALFDRRPL